MIAVITAFSLHYPDAETMNILSGDLADCTSDVFSNRTNVGDSYYCILQNKTAYCKVEAVRDEHLIGVATCSEVYVV